MKLVALKYRSWKCARQQLHGVDHLEIQSCTAGAVPELEHTAGVTGSEDVQPRLPDLFHFGVQNRHGELVLHDVVDSRAAATLIGAFDLDELDTGNCLQQLSRLGPDTLPVNQVARIVVSHTFVQRNLEPARQPRGRQEFRDVFYARGEPSGAFQDVRV